MEDPEYFVASDSLMEKLCEEFQARLAYLPNVSVQYFPYPQQPELTRPVIVAKPTSLTEVMRVVRTASTMKLRVRAVGQYSNYQPHLYADPVSVLVDMSELTDDPRIELVEYKMPDLERVTAVRVLAGVTLHELCDFQVRYQMKLSASVRDPKHTVVGAILTGLHCSSNKHYATLADQVLMMRAVDRRGHLVEYKDYTDGIVNLGMIGVVYDVILRLEEMDCLEVRYTFERAGDFRMSPRMLGKYLEENESVQLLYYPFNSINVHRNAELNAEELNAAVQGWYPDEDEVVVRLTLPSPQEPGEREMVHVSHEFSPELPHVENGHFTPLFLLSRHLEQKISKKMLCVQYAPWTVHCYDDIPEGSTYRKSELTVTVPLGKDFRRFGEFLEKLQSVIQEFSREDKFPINLCIRVDFTPGSRCRLAPSFDERHLPPKEPADAESSEGGEAVRPESGKSGSERKGPQEWYAHISCTSVRVDDGVWAEACTRIMDGFWSIEMAAIMQWNSDWGYVKGFSSALARYHAKSSEQLNKILELVDRDGMFLNEVLASIFYPTADGYRAMYNSQRQLFLEKMSD